MGGPRTSGGGSFPNYNAPPPSHGRPHIVASLVFPSLHALVFLSLLLNARKTHSLFPTLDSVIFIGFVAFPSMSVLTNCSHTIEFINFFFV